MAISSIHPDQEHCELFLVRVGLDSTMGLGLLPSTNQKVGTMDQEAEPKKIREDMSYLPDLIVHLLGVFT